MRCRAQVVRVDSESTDVIDLVAHMASPMLASPDPLLSNRKVSLYIAFSVLRHSFHSSNPVHDPPPCREADKLSNKLVSMKVTATATP